MINPELIIDWAREKGILDNGTVVAQAQKTKEEAQELYEAVVLERHEAATKEDIMLEIGDVLVTIIIQAEMQGLSLEQCFWAAYEKIRYRNGQMVGGQFVKEGDLS